MHWASLPVVLFLFLGYSAGSVMNNAFSYDYSSNNFMSLRNKRQSADPSVTPAPLDHNQSESTDFWWKKNTSDFDQEISIDYMYYQMSVLKPDADDASFNEHYLDILAMLKLPHVDGNSSHPQLADSYRRAVSAKISFNFPFYGHLMQNLTIATGGFCYIGDQTHSWLAATQYIAPLMANFDTNLPKSTVMYADNGTVFVIEWSQVQLRDQPKEGNFTFQVSLHKNGDIWFVYKEVPMAVEKISDTYHPRKLGISDAYLFKHPILPTGSSDQALSKRVIYEYHRVEVPPAEVKSKTVVILKAQPTCISQPNCHSCANATLKHFNCSWCSVRSDKEGGSFCSDEAGLHRRRQDWVSGNCKEQSRNMYCANEDQDKDRQPDQEKATEAQQPETSPDVQQVVPLDSEGRFGDKHKGRTHAAASASTGSGGVVAIVMVLATLVALIGWLTYAYHNPHTSSGQFLIRYRPTRWRWPNSDARCAYTASVHM